MAGIDLTTAQTQLNLWIAASAAVAGGQSYRIGERELRRTDAAEIRKQIDFWEAKVITLTNRNMGRSRARTVVVGG